VENGLFDAQASAVKLKLAAGGGIARGTARRGDKAPCQRSFEFEVALSGEAGQSNAVDLLGGGEATGRVRPCRNLRAKSADLKGT